MPICLLSPDLTKLTIVCYLAITCNHPMLKISPLVHVPVLLYYNFDTTQVEQKTRVKRMEFQGITKFHMAPCRLHKQSPLNWVVLTELTRKLLAAQVISQTSLRGDEKFSHPHQKLYPLLLKNRASKCLAVVMNIGDFSEGWERNLLGVQK